MPKSNWKLHDNTYNSLGKQAFFRQVLLLVLFISLFSSLSAQTGLLSGTVFDEDNQELPGASIQVGDKGTFSDEIGNFSLSLSPGTYTLAVSFIGYQRFSQKIVIAEGLPNFLKVRLLPSSTLLETTTVSSGRYEKPLGEVVVSLEVIQPALLENSNQIQLDKALEKVPGVNIIDGQANIRGGSGFSYGAGSRVLLLLNDLPILTADAGFPNWNDIPIENMDQIEVIKGASSALYGSAALNGVVNFRTDYARQEPVTKLSFFTSTFTSPPSDIPTWWSSAPFSFGTTFLHKQKIGKLDLVANAAYINEQEHNENTYAEYGRIGLQARYRLTDSLNFGINLNYRAGNNQNFFFWASENQLLEGSSGTFSYSENVRYNIDPFLSYRDKKGWQHKLLSRIYVVDNQADQNRSNKSTQFYGEYQAQKSFEDAQLMASLGLVARGASVNAELYGDTTFTMQNIALYGQLDKKVGDYLNLSFGFRWEHNRLENPGFTYENGLVNPSKELESRPVFRFGANYQLGAATFLRTSWGQGYRFPTIAEKYIFTSFAGLFISPNPDLQSETGWNLEVGLKQGFKVGAWKGFLDLAAFHQEYEDMMEFRFQRSLATGFQSQNIGAATISGAELSVTGQAELGRVQLTYLGGYLFIDPRYKDFDLSPIQPGIEPSIGQLNANNASSQEDILKYRSRHSFKWDVQAEWPKFSAGLSYRFGSHQESVDPLLLFAIPGLIAFREENNTGFQVLDLRVAYRIMPEMKVSLLANNILNEVYSVRPGLLEPIRNIALRLDWTL